MKSSMAFILCLALFFASQVAVEGIQCNCGTLTVRQDKGTKNVEVFEKIGCKENSTDYMATDFNGFCFATLSYQLCNGNDGPCASSDDYMNIHFNRIGEDEKTLSQSGKKASFLDKTNEIFSMITTCSTDLCFEDPMKVDQNAWTHGNALSYQILKTTFPFLQKYVSTISSSSNRPLLITTTAATTTSSATKAVAQAANENPQNKQESKAAGETEDGSNTYKYATIGLGVSLALIVILFLVAAILFYCFCWKKRVPDKNDKKDKKKDRKKKSEDENTTSTVGSTGKSKAGDGKDDAAKDHRFQPDPEDPFHLDRQKEDDGPVKPLIF